MIQIKKKVNVWKFSLIISTIHNANIGDLITLDLLLDINP